MWTYEVKWTRVDFLAVSRNVLMAIYVLLTNQTKQQKRDKCKRDDIYTMRSKYSSICNLKSRYTFKKQNL